MTEKHGLTPTVIAGVFTLIAALISGWFVLAADKQGVSLPQENPPRFVSVLDLGRFVQQRDALLELAEFESNRDTVLKEMNPVIRELSESLRLDPHSPSDVSGSFEHFRRQFPTDNERMVFRLGAWIGDLWVTGIALHPMFVRSRSTCDRFKEAHRGVRFQLTSLGWPELARQVPNRLTGECTTNEDWSESFPSFYAEVTAKVRSLD